MDTRLAQIVSRIPKVRRAVPRDPRAAVVAIVIALCQVSTPTRAQAPAGGTNGAVPSLFGQRTLGTLSGPGRGLLGSSGGPAQALFQSGNLLSGNERFLRGNEQGQFVGRDARSVTELFRSLTGGPSDQRGSRRGGVDRGSGGRDAHRTRFGPGGGRGPAGVSRARRPPTRLRVAFAHRSPPSVTTVEHLRSRLNGHLRRRATAVQIDPELRGRTLILRGTVATAGDRALAERLARLEPGVSRVQNRLRVAADPLGHAPR